ncbi:MAG: response regulator [Acidobacteriota bacterium]
MTKLLLVDDEKIFLESLKTGLKKFEHLFQTDICFSVNEAIKNINKNEYELVITDLRMPKKDGIDLLLHLNKINFRGSSKIMSAHNTEESLKKINELGFIDVIAKPFDLEWFENMIVEFFREKEELEKNFGSVDIVIRDICRKSWGSSSLSFESVDLISILQVANVDRRSATFNVKVNGKSGSIDMLEGDIINAEYEKLKGDEAVLKLINAKETSIVVNSKKKKIEKIIDMPFIDFMKGILKRFRSNTDNFEDDFTSDVLSEDKKTSLNSNSKEEKMSTMNDMLTILNNEVNGLQTASIFGKDGLPLAQENPSGIDIDAFSAKFAMVKALVSKTVKDLSNGTLNEIIVEEENGWFILRPLGNSGLSLFIAVDTNATLGNLRLVAKKLAAEAEKLT